MSQDRLNDSQRIAFFVQDRRRQVPDCVEPERLNLCLNRQALHEMLPVEKWFPEILSTKRRRFET
jgi:hypothetical protein